MAVAYRDSVGASANTTSLGLVIPATVVVGDVLLAALGHRDASSITAPGGWTQIANTVSATPFFGAGLWWRIAQAGDAGATATWTTVGSERWSGAIAAYSGTHATTPVAASAFDDGTGSTTTSVTFAALAGAVAGGMDVLMPVVRGGANGVVSFAPPGTHTERVDQSGTATGVPNVAVTVADVATSGGTAASATITSTPAVRAYQGRVLLQPPPSGADVDVDGALSASAGFATTAATTLPAGAAVTAAAGVTASAGVAQPATAAVTASAGFTATATGTRPTTATVTGTAGFTATATVGAAPINADGTRPVTATITSAAAVTTAGAATRTATAAFTATAANTTDGASTRTVTAGIAAAASNTTSGAASRAAAASFTALAAVITPASAALTATAAHTATADVPSTGWGPPPNITATPVSQTQIDLAWDAVVAASGYDIERDGVVIATDVVGTTFSDTGLNPGTEYDYRLRSVRA